MRTTIGIVTLTRPPALMRPRERRQIAHWLREVAAQITMSGTWEVDAFQQVYFFQTSASKPGQAVSAIISAGAPERK